MCLLFLGRTKIDLKSGPRLLSWARMALLLQLRFIPELLVFVVIFAAAAAAVATVDVEESSLEIGSKELGCKKQLAPLGFGNENGCCDGLLSSVEDWWIVEGGMLSLLF